MRDPTNESGTALIEFVWLTILLLVPLFYIVLAVFDVQRTAFASATAVRSATRAFVTAPDHRTAEQRAMAAARLAFTDQGIDPDFELVLRCRPAPDQCLTPGSSVVAVIAARSVLPLMPPVFGGQPPAVTVSATHRSPYGMFREARP